MTNIATNSRKRSSPGNPKNNSNNGGAQQQSASAPAFLRKTFALITACDPAVASWSDDGLTFVVKDPKKFQYECIPKYFKHNNFSSFVRQLNFYGFHKVKSDPLCSMEEPSSHFLSEESRLWRFHHEKFQRGRPELLCEVRKPCQTETAERQDVDSLKDEIKTLRDQLATMAREMAAVKALFGSLLDGQVHQVGSCEEEEEALEEGAYNDSEDGEVGVLVEEERPSKKARQETVVAQPQEVHTTASASAHPATAFAGTMMTADDLSGLGMFDIEPRPLRPHAVSPVDFFEMVGARGTTPFPLEKDEGAMAAGAASSLFTMDPFEDISILESCNLMCV